MYGNGLTMSKRDMQDYNITGADIDAVEKVAQEAGFSGTRDDVSCQMRSALINNRVSIETLKSREYWDKVVSSSSH
jgi:hypothetical protein